MPDLGAIAQSLIGKVFDNTIVPGTELAVAGKVHLRSAPATYNATTGTTARTNTPVDVRLVFKAYNNFEIAGSNGLIQAGDVEVIIPINASIPDVAAEDRVEDAAGKLFRIVTRERVQLGTLALVIKAQCRAL